MPFEERVPPRNLDAERAVLGACMLSKDVLGNTAEILRPDDFYDNNNKLAYEIMLGMYTSDKPVDFVTVSEELKNHGAFDRLGGQPFLAGLVSDITTTANASYHADIIRERSLRRRLIEAGNKIIELAYKTDVETSQIINDAEKIIFEAAQNKNTTDFRSISELLTPTFKKIEDRYKNTGADVTGFPSGFDDLDKIITGFQPGSLNIIAARPSMGKTALALNIAQFGGNLEKNLPVLIFSLEMSAEQLVQRMLAAESQINISHMNTGMMGKNDWDVLVNAAGKITPKNIYINDDSDLTTLDFRTKCRRFKNRNPELGLVIVDYLQLMSAGNRRSESRQQEISEISRLLKIVARELDCPVIALSQLSREAEKRTDKKPQLSDLRDSGAIEQDADTVILIFREDYYQEEQLDPNEPSKADIRVAKNRNGGTGFCNLMFKREITRFFPCKYSEY